MHAETCYYQYINGFREKNVLNTKDVFFYALQFLFEIFFKIYIIYIIYRNKWKKPLFYGFFMVFIIKFKFAPIFTMLFVISASKYVNIRSSKVIGGQNYSELYPIIVYNDFSTKLLFLVNNKIIHDSFSSSGNFLQLCLYFVSQK